jgi:nitrogenase delta subunit
MDAITKERVSQLEGYIMKHCLWQFHSRAWDRTRQNKGILGQTAMILRGEEVDVSDPLERCHWVDAVILADAYRESFPWVNGLSAGEVTEVMDGLLARIEHLTVTGSLNKELTDQHY